ncbi:LacI family DNA-binding transcriptional regulator [Coraliomargarita algicola]|uniref:LacI family DNA-binding transcriptional regulator n=1 Tax=Coraliomargarita algicola TaxID=3092156 RepID=A0ABZ0RIJ4_9BACT|nr:LacI family DNA-binding transcriptional regulator [Coraliomargarita sp. J2-16]WPJ94903.1 LacI family DNA-binding transcriptional regulator [Coraliomargarita sp. J2-16]
MNIRSIAKESGLSVATVSRVLNNESGVSDEARQKALKVIERSGYKPRNYSQRRGTRIAIVVEAGAPSFDSFYSLVFTGISRYAWECGFEATLVYYSPDHERNSGGELVDLLRKKRCNGAVLIAPISESEGQNLIDARIPSVLVAHRLSLDGIGYIDCNNFQGASDLTEYLLHLGHRKIGYLCGNLENGNNSDRLNGYLKAMESVGVEVDDGWMIEHHPTDVTEQAGYDQALFLLERYPDITAIFANNDSMAYGAVTACMETGLRVPEDISVVGYDDYLSSRYYNPSLTTMRQPLMEMGASAARWVDEKLKNKISDLPHRVFRGELIVRKSCALPRADS